MVLVIVSSLSEIVNEPDTYCFHVYMMCILGASDNKFVFFAEVFIYLIGEKQRLGESNVEYRN